MVLLPNTVLETFPICFKKYSPICYLRQTNRYVPRKLPDMHSAAAKVAPTLPGGQYQRHAQHAVSEQSSRTQNNKL